mmetsp:Transcript_7634/g.13970  ORF Transcript_7634/g.13970 Transcript_7634/m.13970 type:complete len:243 (+) Transcript_7634:56-784(+)
MAFTLSCAFTNRDGSTRERKDTMMMKKAASRSAQSRVFQRVSIQSIRQMYTMILLVAANGAFRLWTCQREVANRTRSLVKKPITHPSLPFIERSLLLHLIYTTVLQIHVFYKLFRWIVKQSSQGAKNHLQKHLACWRAWLDSYVRPQIVLKRVYRKNLVTKMMLPRVTCKRALWYPSTLKTWGPWFQTRKKSPTQTQATNQETRVLTTKTTRLMEEPSGSFDLVRIRQDKVTSWSHTYRIPV